MRTSHLLSALCVLLLAAAGVQATLQPFSRSKLALEECVPRQVRLHQTDSRGWYWAYEGIAQAQTFHATGRDVEALYLRVARLQGLPAAPLDVEIRDEKLKVIYAQGQIAPTDAGRNFRWAQVALDFQVPLQKGRTYVILLHSRRTSHQTPWLINARFGDVYPQGRHLGYADDLFFSISFTSGADLHVGPSFAVPGQLPIGLGKAGDPSTSKTPALSFAGQTCPRIARNDPIGPIPEGRKITGKTMPHP